MGKVSKPLKKFDGIPQLGGEEPEDESVILGICEMLRARRTPDSRPARSYTIPRIGRLGPQRIAREEDP